MPCYQVNLISVQFKAKHVNILQAAAKALKWSFYESGRYVACGTVKIDMQSQQAEALSQSSINALKREYSRQAVDYAAKKKKWFVKKLTHKKLELRRY